MSKSESLKGIAIQWLTAQLPADWPVSGQVPKNIPDKFITVSRTRGGREYLVLDNAELLFEVYSRNSDLEASNMADHVADIIKGLEQYHDITHSKTNSVVELADTIRGLYRYSVYVDIRHRR